MAIDRRFLEINLAVQGIVNEPPTSPAPANGTQYIVGASGTGAFADADPNMLARYNAASGTWKFTAPTTGQLEVLNLATSEVLNWDGSAWTTIATLGGGGEGSGVTVVKDFAYTRSSLPDVKWYKEGDFLINTSTGKFYQLRDYQGTGTLSWEEYTYFSNGTKFASINDGKIYVKNEDGEFEADSELQGGDLVFSLSAFGEARRLCIYDSSTHYLLSLATAKDFGETTDDEGTLYIGSHTLTADDIQTKAFILPTAIMRDSNNKRHMLLSVEGVQMVQGVDFGIGGDIGEDTWLNWNNKGMAQLDLVPGDVLCFAYAYASE